MGRQKSVPTKLKNAEDHWTGQNSMQHYDYIPVKKRKCKTKKKFGHLIIPASEQVKQFYLGELCIGNTNNLIPENWTSCRAEFSERMEEDLILEFDSCYVVVKMVFEKAFLKDLFSSKVFALNICSKGGQVHVDLFFVNLPLLRFNRKTGSCIQTIFSLLYNISDTVYNNCNIDKEDEANGEDIVRLYKSIRKYREKELNLSSEDVQHPRLKPELRPYQTNAVRWMLHREKNSQTEEDLLHPLYTKVTLKSGADIYYDKHTGYVDTKKPLIAKPSLGGILADEMGLGKTVEVLACILLHTRNRAEKPYNLENSSPGTSQDFDSNKSPTVQKVHRKRKLDHDNKTSVESELVDQPKKLKVPADWVKSSSKKSKTFIALQMWYENCLQDVKKREKVFKKDALQCVCGTDNEDGVVICKDCGKMQHGACLGYKEIYGAYRCPQCWINQPLMECDATLIVSPIALRTQWCNEICRHVKGDFKVLQYGGSSATPVYPTELLKYDVVVTTYNVLQSELRLTETEKVVSFRHQRRYSPPGSPLTRVKWWRLCLDEAQTVEAPTSMVSAMAQKLNANFRWAVTGTPISKKISDLYGLLDYLHMEPYNDRLTWKYLLYDPYVHGNVEPMYTFLSKVLWRSAKDDILDQIDIPKQTITSHWLQFSAVEQYFYKCEHESSRDSFLEKVKKLDPDKPLQTMDKSSLKSVLAPLLSLRHVCTYPNSIKTRYLATRKPVNSMKDLLEALVAKNTSESEEYLRIVLCSLNGLAGIYLLLQSPFEAISHYRQVLQLYTRFTEEEKIEKLNIDKLQIIHTMHNLAETLDMCPDISERTLRDENLRKDCKEVEQKYIEKFINQSMTALQDSLIMSNSVEKLQNSFIFTPGKWYSDLLEWIYINDYKQELYSRIDNAHTTANVECTIDFRNERGLLYSIANWDEKISDLRQVTIEVVNNLYTHCPDDEFQIIIAQQLVQSATDCHLRPQKKNKSKKKCPICASNDSLKNYEFKLFSMSKRTTNFEEMSLKGSWKPTTEELVFKSILGVSRGKNVNHDLMKDGETHINILDTLKKEFKEIRKLWTFLDQQVCAQDELDMCKTRLTLKDGNEQTNATPKMKTILKNLTYTLENKLETIHCLDEHELEYQRSSLHNEERQNMALLEKYLGIRSYLETLHKQQYEGQNPDPCPICKNTLEQHYSIIACGHSYCLQCIQLLMEQTRGHHVQCSVCRARHLVKDISYIKQGHESTDSDDGVTVKGNFSTKVEGVIKLLMKLKNEDPTVKVLIFSSWSSVLKYLKDALHKNDITAELGTSQNLEKQIEKFKDMSQNITSLLLPVQLGSKGLNLVEATHVILIEPLTNPGDELQAIGRVHRIGQTKPTFVHKFFIKDTIEENIQKATSTHTQNWEKNKVTLRQLMDLFVTVETVDEATADCPIPG